MTIDRFTTEQFEAVLDSSPHDWELAEVDSERVYNVILNWHVAIRIRSSIGESGIADAVGKDSIRMMLIDSQDGRMYSKLKDVYTTRVPGWEVRMMDKVNTLLEYYFHSGDCLECNRPKSVYRTKKDNRLFCKCFDCDHGFKWLESPTLHIITSHDPEPYFAPDEGSSSQPPFLANSHEGVSLSTDSKDSMDSTIREELPSGVEPETDRSAPFTEPVSQPARDISDLADETDTQGSTPELENDFSWDTFDEVVPEFAGEEIAPNEQQLEAITAPLNGQLRVFAGPGAGKCLGKGTPILMYDGIIKLVEDVQVGDNLMGPDSQPRVVKSLSRGREMLYEVQQKNGDNYIVNESHILSLKVSGTEWTKRARRPRYGFDGDIVNISVHKYLSSSNRKRHHLKGYKTNVDWEFHPVPIEPYFLGLWLGDGHNHIASITNEDQEVIDYIYAFAGDENMRVRRDKHRDNIYHLVQKPDIRTNRNPIKKTLLELNVLENKHIPTVYKVNCESVRLQLLAGLLDSDGHYQSSKGYFSITQKREVLANDIMFVARSLGFRVSKAFKIVNDESYVRLAISGNVNRIPTRISRKQAAMNTPNKDWLRCGIKASPIGEGDYFGFELTGDRLFLLGDFTVTHNTFVLVRRLRYLIENKVSMANILAVTLTKTMIDDLYNKTVQLMPGLADTPLAARNICTIHAACFRMLKEQGDHRRKIEGWRTKKFTKEVLTDLWSDEDDRPTWQEVNNMIGNAMYHGVTPDQDFAFFQGLVSSFHSQRLHEARRIIDGLMERNNFITFHQMVYDVEQKLLNDARFRKIFQDRYHYILVDEGQDTNGQAMRVLAMLAKPQDNFFIVGDADQCVLEGELVLTPSGYKPIEQIKQYDKVIAAIGKSKSAYRYVLGVSKREDMVWVTKITTESGKTIRVTHNHLCFATAASLSTHTRHTKPNAHYVYIMFKKDYGYRIGVSKNPKNRLLGEHADKLWLIRMHDNVKDAYYDEALLSAKYGIPTMTFVDHTSKDKRRTHKLNSFDQEYMDRLFKELDTTSSVNDLASNEGFLFDRCPTITAQGFGKRTIAYVTMCASRNTKVPTHLISVETSELEAIDKLREAGIPLTKSKAGKRYRYITPDIRKVQQITSLLKDQVGCEIVVRAALVSKDNMDGAYSLTPHLMPAGNILPGYFVPTITDGKVSLEQVVSIEKEQSFQTVYDLEVDGVANYFVGGICVHNTLFRFAGATPEANLFDGFESRYPDGTMIKLDVNYRSTQRIIQAQMELIQNNYSGKGGPYEQRYLKDVLPREDAPVGEFPSFTMYTDAMQEAQSIANDIVSETESNGRHPDHYFIGARTRAQTAYLEGPFMRAEIPYINLNGAAFWDSKPVQDVISYLKLAHDPKDKAAFKRVYNIPTIYWTAPWGDDKGQYIPHRYLGRAFLAVCGESYQVCRKAVRSSWNEPEGWKYSFAVGAEDLVEFVDELTGLLSTDGVSEALEHIIQTCYKKYLLVELGIKEADGDGGVLDDLEMLTFMAGEFEDAEEFLTWIDFMTEQARKAANKDWAGHVVMGTVHKLKGLERPVVYGIGLSETDDGEDMVSGLLPHTFSLRPPPQNGIFPGQGKSRMEDERCIAFVLMSRAQQEVHFSGVFKYRDVPMGMSRFASEFSQECQEDTSP